MSKINFDEKWSILRGVKATCVDFAGPSNTSSKNEGAYGGKGTTAGGQAVEAKNRAGKGTQKLSGRKCIMPDGSVNPQCDEYNPSLVGREKLLPGSDEGTIRENIKRLMHGDSGYSSAYLQKGAHGHTYTAAQAAAIAYKKAGKSGPATGGGGGDKTAKQKFLDKHLPKYHRTSFENKAAARQALHSAWDDHKAEMESTTAEVQKYLQSNPDATPEQIMQDLAQAKVGRGLDEDDFNSIIEQATGKKMSQGQNQGFQKVDGGDALDTLKEVANKTGSLKNPGMFIEEVKRQMGSINGADTPEGYQQMIEKLQKLLGPLAEKNPDLNLDNPEVISKILQASGFTPPTMPETPIKRGARWGQVQKMLGKYTPKGTRAGKDGSTVYTTKEHEAANARRAAANNQRDLAALPPEENPEILDKIGQAIDAKPAPPPQRPGQLPRTEPPQNPDTKQRMAAAGQQLENQKKQDAVALRNAANQVIKEQRAPAPAPAEQPSSPAPVDVKNLHKDDRFKQIAAALGITKAKDLKDLATKLAGMGQTPSTEGETTRVTTGKTSGRVRKPPAANDDTPAPAAKPPAAKKNEKPASQAPRKGRSARGAVTQGKGDDSARETGTASASEYNFSAPYGWSFCESSPSVSHPKIKSNVVTGEDANRNLVKIPETWSQR